MRFDDTKEEDQRSLKMHFIITYQYWLKKNENLMAYESIILDSYISDYSAKLRSIIAPGGLMSIKL